MRRIKTHDHLAAVAQLSASLGWVVTWKALVMFLISLKCAEFSEYGEEHPTMPHRCKVSNRCGPMTDGFWRPGEKDSCSTYDFRFPYDIRQSAYRLPDARWRKMRQAYLEIRGHYPHEAEAQVVTSSEYFHSRMPVYQAMLHGTFTVFGGTVNDCLKMQHQTIKRRCKEFCVVDASSPSLLRIIGKDPRGSTFGSFGSFNGSFQCGYTTEDGDFTYGGKVEMHLLFQHDRFSLASGFCGDDHPPPLEYQNQVFNVGCPVIDWTEAGSSWTSPLSSTHYGTGPIGLESSLLPRARTLDQLGPTKRTGNCGWFGFGSSSEDELNMEKYGQQCSGWCNIHHTCYLVNQKFKCSNVTYSEP